MPDASDDHEIAKLLLIEALYLGAVSVEPYLAKEGETAAVLQVLPTNWRTWNNKIRWSLGRIDRADLWPTTDPPLTTLDPRAMGETKRHDMIEEIRTSYQERRAALDALADTRTPFPPR